MLDLICVTDINDKQLGLFFKESHKYLKEFFGGLGIEANIQDLDSTTLLSQQVFNDAIRSKTGKTLVIAYSHGNVDEFRINNFSYIDKNNSIELKNSFIYSTACSTAKGIGKQLMSDGCIAFVGYEKETYAEFCDPVKQQTIIQCDHACLFSFLSDPNKTILDAFHDAIKYFDSKIKYVEQTDKDILFVDKLVQNKEALRIEFNNNITRQDLEY